MLNYNAQEANNNSQLPWIDIACAGIAALNPAYCPMLALSLSNGSLLHSTEGSFARVLRMPPKSQSVTFIDKVRQSTSVATGKPMAFASVSPDISQTHLRRGRITARIALGSSEFDALMEPDGNLGHWFLIPSAVLKKEGLGYGHTASFTMYTLKQQPEPALPSFFHELLRENASAQSTWDKTTTLARIDWIHWMESAKQTETKRKRAQDAIEQLANGKKRVCCFDPSGVYSKALSCPTEVDA